MTAMRERCCVCGRELPNRYAVAGRCEADGCGAAFCALHWHNGNRRCPEHGGHGGKRKIDKETVMNENKITESESEIRERAQTELSPQAKESILKSVVSFAVSLGKGTAALADRIRGIKDPNEVLSAFDAQLKANRERREPLSSRYERLYAEIAAKKKVYVAAPPARRKILELELRGLLSEYQGIERQLAVYFENERIINTVRGRTLELTAMGLRKISEKEIDRLTDRIEDAVDSGEDVTDALRDLENAGRRRDTDDADAFADALAGFDENAVGEAASDGGVGQATGSDAAPKATENLLGDFARAGLMTFSVSWTRAWPPSRETSSVRRPVRCRHQRPKPPGRREMRRSFRRS